MISELHQKLIKQEITATQLVGEYFTRIQEKDQEIQAFVTLNKEQALAQAEKIDDKIKQGEDVGILAGIPYAVKDNILVKGLKCTASSKILENYTAAYDATVIKKLNQAGAIILGKTNLDEFAMGSSTENSAFFTTKNPYDKTRVPGGSSGGSAAAVASEMSVFALGSDTGGSIRQPAAFCGLVGFKPTYGAVSRFGLMAMASSLDVIGPLAQSIEDAEMIFKVISGKDLMDSTSQDVPVPLNKIQKTEYRIQDTVFGLPKEYFIKGLAPEIEAQIQNTIAKLQSQFATFQEVSLPLTPYALPCYYIIMPAEVSSNLARYDSIRYSPITNYQFPITTLRDLYFKTRGQCFGKEVRRRVILGTYVLSKGYYDAYYKKAQKVRRLIREEFNEVFKKVDFLLTPTTPTPAFKIGEKTSDPLAMYLSDIFTVAANITGLPALNLPIGFTKDNLPIGLQLIGPPNSDFQLLELAKIIEQILE
ncbi:MAG: aspartyl-tRNA(Asn)/glutamyl-tRNA(Gln) amidotransferase subunit [Patescibacteria group bacterium]|nr:aspartyl-tRNA(Asn)/glutamyl-tRNA(Gln) amidotransferase subunit [Patescibacteria group bacterium]